MTERTPADLIGGHGQVADGDGCHLTASVEQLQTLTAAAQLGAPGQPVAQGDHPQRVLWARGSGHKRRADRAVQKYVE